MRWLLGEGVARDRYRNVGSTKRLALLRRGEPGGRLLSFTRARAFGLGVSNCYSNSEPVDQLIMLASSDRHYFEPINGMTLVEVQRTMPENATLELDCDAVNKAYREVDSTRAPNKWLRAWHNLSEHNCSCLAAPATARAEQVKRFVRVRAELQARAKAEWDRITSAAPHHSVLGVHMRGTDAHVARPSVQSDFFAMIDAYVATHGGPEAVLIFLATDDEHFVSSARERLGTARVQMQAAGAVMRGSADKPTWQDNRGSRNLQRGTEVVVDTLLLSRCDFLLKSGRAACR